jgi:hypothetical protein
MQGPAMKVQHSTPQGHRLEVVERYIGGKKSNVRVWTLIASYIEAQTKSNGLCMALTASGMLGLFPPLTRPGDEICVLDGFTIPVVLRKHDNGYQHVGGCYVDGLMEGEAGDMLREGRARLKLIKIY